MPSLSPASLISMHILKGQLNLTCHDLDFLHFRLTSLKVFTAHMGPSSLHSLTLRPGWVSVLAPKAVCCCSAASLLIFCLPVGRETLGNTRPCSHNAGSAWTVRLHQFRIQRTNVKSAVRAWESIHWWIIFKWASQVVQYKEPASAGNTRVEGAIPAGRSPGGGNSTHSSILAWETPWTEEPGGLQSTGSQKRGYWACTHAHTHTQSLSR